MSIYLFFPFFLNHSCLSHIYNL